MDDASLVRYRSPGDPENEAQGVTRRGCMPQVVVDDDRSNVRAITRCRLVEQTLPSRGSPAAASIFTCSQDSRAKAGLRELTRDGTRHTWRGEFGVDNLFNRAWRDGQP